MVVVLDGLSADRVLGWAGHLTTLSWRRIFGRLRVEGTKCLRLRGRVVSLVGPPSEALLCE